MTDSNYNFSERCVKLGIATLAAGIEANFVPCLYLWIRYGAIPPWPDMLKIWGLLAFAYGIGWVVQPISFFPLMGTAGSYQAWLSGSVAEIKSPAATMAQKAAGYEDGSQESEVIRSMGISVSTMTCVCLITIFAFAGARIVGILPEEVKRSFTFMLPAIFGAVYANLSVKYILMGVLAIILALTCFMFLPIPAWSRIHLIVISGIVIGNLVYQFSEND